MACQRREPLPDARTGALDEAGEVPVEYQIETNSDNQDASDQSQDEQSSPGACCCQRTVAVEISGGKRTPRGVSLAMTRGTPGSVRH